MNDYTYLAPSPSSKLVTAADQAEAVFAQEGPLSARFTGYEPRPGQVRLTREIAQAIQDEQHLLAEGPCGVGKAMAYLVPAIQYARRTGRRVLVATATIALQEQLVHKDLPALQEVLEEDFTFALIKGRSNYLCPSRMDEVFQRNIVREFKKAEKACWRKLEAWAQRTKTGDVSELDFRPLPTVWSKVCGDAVDCDKDRCATSECFNAKAKEEAEDADVIVCNYHILFSHLKLLADSGGKSRLLPEYDVLICDEGHQMAEIARTYFGMEVTPYALWRLVGPLRREPEGRAVSDAMKACIRRFQEDLASYASRSSYSARIREKNFVDCEHILAQLADIRSFWRERAKSTTNERDKRLHRRRGEWAGGLLTKIEQALDLEDENFVYWIEGRGEDVSLKGCPIEVGHVLHAHVFEATPSVIVASATLTTAGNFQYIRNQIGVQKAREVVVPSEFDFSRQAVLAIPKEAPAPNTRDFVPFVADAVQRLIEMADGRTLALFTSYRNLNEAHELIKGTSKHRVLCQGEAPVRQLVQAFRDDVSSVLLGTASLWTGVDVQGESLTCLVIDKLPFPSPDDAVMSAITEKYPKSWFMDHSVPRAIMTLRQGFGRLIRSKTDRGVVAILDERLFSKRYGQLFLNSLPSCVVLRDLEQVRSFLLAPRI